MTSVENPVDVEQTRDANTTQDLEDLRDVWLIRAFEEKVRELRVAGDVVGSVHLCIGQEATPVAIKRLLGPDDALFVTYRGHGYGLMRGIAPTSMFAELLGRATGINSGRGGSAYFIAPEHRFFGENSIVGAGAPIACGAALAGRFDGSNRVAITVFGDGAMNQGSVHEAMNFAAAMRLPVVFLCENNSYSEMTPIADMVGDPNLFRRADAYGMPGERIDGNDPTSLRQRISQAIAAAREGGGPILLELMTARLVGHYIGDAEQYRIPGELDRAHETEPVSVLTRRLIDAGCSRETLDRVEADAREEIEAAAAAALVAPLADPATAKDHVYA
jgi:TPP-dependent pyruvate/acetoin dehydrogenase alpha subunit